MPFEIQLPDSPPIGFVTRDSRKGERVEIATRAFVSSEDADLLVELLEHIEKIFISRRDSRILVNPSSIDHFLIVVPPTGPCTVYINELGLEFQARASKPIEAGQVVGTYSVTGNPEGIAFDGEQMWVTDRTGGQVHVVRATDGITVDTIAVGADRDSNVAFQAGAAYVFVKPAGGWESAVDNGKLTAALPFEFDRCGLSVGVGEGFVVAGAWGDDQVAQKTGAALVFVRPVTGWSDMTTTAKLVASDAVSGDHLVPQTLNQRCDQRPRCSRHERHPEA